MVSNLRLPNVSWPFGRPVGIALAVLSGLAFGWLVVGIVATLVVGR